MKILIKQGECLWSEIGTHVIDEKGFAKTADQDVEVDILPEHYDRVLSIVEAERAVKALPVEEPQEEVVEENEQEQEETVDQ